MTGPKDTVYAGETYRLQLTFPTTYPYKPPSAYFLSPVPRHQHVYSNGDMCLNLLGSGWQPAMTAETLVVSVLSILCNAKEKRLPPDNALHSDISPGQTQEKWMYHDDTC